MTEFVLEKDIRKITEDKSALNLGEYQDVYKTSKLFWATEYQQFFRVTRMWRKAQVISETNCIVEIFGIGFNGRIFSQGSSTPKLLVIEVYSIWNSQKYVAILNMLELRILLGEKSELLRPGCKMDVVKSIVASLYFKYTVTISSHHNDERNMVPDILVNNNEHVKLNKASSGVNTTSNGSNNSNKLGNIMNDRDDEHRYSKCYLQVQTVVHLENPKMPKGYPTSIEQMIRIPPLLPDDISLPIPIITQELALKVGKCGNGIKGRILEAKQRSKRIEEEDKRKRLLWLSTIKRKRDLVGTRLVRKGLRFALVNAYHEALRPTTITVRSMVLDEAVNMKLYIGLNAIQSLLDIKQSSLTWTTDEVKSYTSQVLKFINIKLLDGNRVVLKLDDLSSSEAVLVKTKSFSNLIRTIKYRKDCRTVVCLWDKLVSVDDATSTATTTSKNASNDDSTEKDEIVKPPLQSLSIEQEQRDPSSLSEYQCEKNSWLSLGRNGRNRTHYGKLLGIILRPFSEIDQGMRLTSRSTRVGRVFCIYKLYAHTKVGFRGSVPEWPPKENVTSIDIVEDIADNSENKSKLIIDSDSDDFILPGNQEDDDDSELNEDADLLSNENSVENIIDIYNDQYATIATGLILELSIYIPYGGYYGNLAINAGTKYKLRFQKNDLDTLVSVKKRPLLGTALRSLYRQFYYEATEEEVTQAEEAWDIIGREIMSRSRWDVNEQQLDIFKLRDINNMQKLGKTDMIQENLCFHEKIKYIKSLTQKYASLSQHEVDNSSSNASSSHVVSIAKVNSNLPPNSPSNNTKIKFSEDGKDNQKIGIQPKEVSVSNKITKNVSLNIDDTDIITVENEKNESVFLKPSYLTLTWSNLIYRKVMKIKSAVISRGEFALLQVDVWQQNDVLGVVCYDKAKNDVYFTQHTDEALLSSQIHSFRFMTDSERILQIYFFLSAQLTYTEYFDKSDKCQGKITFMDVELEKSTIELSNVIEEDYSSNTEIMLAAAQEKAKARLKRK